MKAKELVRAHKKALSSEGGEGGLGLGDDRLYSAATAVK